MAAKSHHLNLFSSTDDAVKSLDIDAGSSEVVFSGAASLKFSNALKLVDATNGDVENVATKLYTLEAAIASGNAGSAAASALVQTNLDSYETSNNAALATLSATVTNNRALAVAEHTFDADARTALDTSLSAAVTAEETARIAAVNTLTSTITTESTNRAAAISSEATSRAAAIQTVTDAVNVEKGRIDAILASADVSLDTLKEIADAFASADTSTLTTIATMQTALTALQAQVDQLTSGN